MTLTRAFSLDTPPVSGAGVLSAANFREVAPEIVSPLSFSLIGAGMEEGFREVGHTVGLRIDGPTPEFLAYVAYRPFHVMSSIDGMIARLPIMHRSDVWELLLGGPPPLSGEPRRRTARPLKAFNSLRMLGFIRRNGVLAGEAAGLVAAAEERALGALHDDSPLQAAMGLDLAFRAARASWALHTRTTTVATGVAAGLRRLFEQDHDDHTATDLLRHAARRASEAGVASASAGRLTTDLDRLSSYEVADGSERFRRFASATATARPLEKGMALNGDQPGGSVGSVPVPRATLAGRASHRMLDVLDTTLAERERSKELGLRSLHCVRLLLSAGAAGLEPGDAALLGASELPRLSRDERDRLVARRAEELDEAAGLDVPVDLQERGDELHPLRRPALRFSGSMTGTPLAPGWAEGPPVNLGSGDRAEIVCGERVDGNYVLAVRPAGVVTGFGSLLSHVAIVCRELGIPLVSGIHVDEDEAHGAIQVDGWTGLVARVGE